MRQNDRVGLIRGKLSNFPFFFFFFFYFSRAEILSAS
jgi:hypothetical protein